MWMRSIAIGLIEKCRMDMINRWNTTTLQMVLLAITAVSTDVSAAVYRCDTSNYLQALEKVLPGDRVLLAPGDYLEGLPVHYLNGIRNSPIVIESMQKGAPARFIGPSGKNTISIINSSHVVIRNLELRGLGSSGDGVKAEGFTRCDWAHHITLEGLQIVGFGWEGSCSILR